MRRHRHSQLGNSEYLQKIILFFLIGFFVGAVFYYFFQHSNGIRAITDFLLQFSCRTNGKIFFRAIADSVAVVPCTDFGFSGYIRLSYAISMKQIGKGIDQIEAFLKGLDFDGLKLSFPLHLPELSQPPLCALTHPNVLYFHLALPNHTCKNLKFVRCAPAEFGKRKDYIYDRLKVLPYVNVIEPKGTFYAFVDVSNVLYFHLALPNHTCKNLKFVRCAPAFYSKT